MTYIIIKIDLMCTEENHQTWGHSLYLLHWKAMTTANIKKNMVPHHHISSSCCHVSARWKALEWSCHCNVPQRYIESLVLSKYNIKLANYHTIEFTPIVPPRPTPIDSFKLKTAVVSKSYRISQEILFAS